MSRRVLVTGASRGIGARIACAFHENGDEVWGTATSDAGAEAVAAKLGVGRGLLLKAESSESIEALASSLKSNMPEVLVNSAGVTRDNLLLRMSREEWYSVLNVNVSSLFHLCKPVVRAMMRARWGRIINISSVVARMGNAGQVNYAASKGAIEAFTRSLAQEVGSRGITVNAVAPGFIDTDMTRALSENVSQALLESVPLRRFGTADDVASLAVFLASDSAGYITGQTIAVNGGMLMA
ncbi:MAG: 3-oxoacyl-ACP reductase FabG [Gammaproteobacteria bacterium]|nr:3-oxoacyl-ACP reductase FabG [Gammaproteobacteria bacterium]MCY4198835.1 3-oxoacyl-ACP reductase FabG [Gammaproteobacteria bacterium]MCY4277148.1 3-oxoacyl-ACP reductase FabG [Gammaproteobacteria bacterium]MCY4323354.1 3-oxoacyl-ACP reductase FabG [Gammaproteobacteria bacterium]